MTKPRILVTAAAGHTGSAAVFQLLEMGFPIRAFVRRRDARATALEQIQFTLVHILRRRNSFGIPWG